LQFTGHNVVNNCLWIWSCGLSVTFMSFCQTLKKDWCM